MSRLATLLVIVLCMTAVRSEDAADETKPIDTFDAQGHMDWGSYYDPQNVFCGKYDCYKILGFDYEEYDKEPPSKSDITKRYRSLSRLWHPDKNKRRDAKERFVKIARAYEVLTDKDTRTEYDRMRYDQDAYFDKYGASVLWSYAPQTDATVICIMLLSLGSLFSWFVQKNKWQTVADRLTQASVEDWGHRDGGTTESKNLRQRALEVLEEKNGAGANNGSSPPTKSNSPTKNKKSKLTGKEKKKQLEDSLRPIIVELVNKMDDFGGGFHKPTWRDLLVVKLVKLPKAVASGLVWHTKYFVRRLRKLELSEEEREVLTRRAVGEVTWAAVSKEDQEEMKTLDLWISDNLQDWREAQEVKSWSVGDQKRYARMKKKGIKMHDE